jgi:transposase
MIPSGAVYLVSGITDMRKSIDGLSLIVADVLEMDPLSSAWFIFCNRGQDKIKTIADSRKAALSGPDLQLKAISISLPNNLTGYYLG